MEANRGDENKVTGTLGLYSGQKRRKDGLVSQKMSYKDVGSNYYVIRNELLRVRETLGWFVRSLLPLAPIVITCSDSVVIKFGVVDD